LTESRWIRNWVYTAQIDADGNVIKNEKGEIQYEWANRFWAKNDKGAYRMENGKHVMTYWVEDEKGWVLNPDGSHVVREMIFSDINWDYAVQEKYFHVYEEASGEETEEEYNARMQRCQENLN